MVEATIRPATPADRGALRRLQALLPEPNPALLDHGFAAGHVLVTTATMNAETMNAATANGTAGAGAGGTPVGYLLAVGGDDVHVAELAVDPAYRREGRAGALLSALFDRCPAGTRVTLTVAPDNRRARALYADYGFEQVERIADHYEDGDGLLLAREC